MLFCETFDHPQHHALAKYENYLDTVSRGTILPVTRIWRGGGREKRLARVRVRHVQS
jgi:hypothetical protein